MRASPVPGYTTATMVIRSKWMTKVGPFDPALQKGDSADWIQRANDLGARSELVEDVLLHRRLHAQNRSRTNASESRDEFLHLLKSRLNRRRFTEKTQP
jgi:hypothetical protein